MHNRREFSKFRLTIRDLSAMLYNLVRVAQFQVEALIVQIEQVTHRCNLSYARIVFAVWRKAQCASQKLIPPSAVRPFACRHDGLVTHKLA